MAWKFDNERIKTARELKDITQEELAIRAGVAVQQVSQWERGEVKPGQESLLKLCGALECPPKFFFVESDDDNHQKEAA